MKKTLLLIATLSLVACGDQDNSVVDTAKAAQNLTYFQDAHGNCFAALNSGSRDGWLITSITAVPCDRTPGGGL